MERWIAVAVNTHTGLVKFLGNAGGDQETARNWTSRHIEPPADPLIWIGNLPLDVIFIGKEQYEGLKVKREYAQAASRAQHNKLLGD